MNLEVAIKYALSGEAILFLGSGASVGAINQNDECFPIGSLLAERLYPGSYNLDQSADLFCEDKEKDKKDGKQELIYFLKNQFIAKRITEHQKMIPLVPWKRIYTTNYDNIVEKSYYESGKYIRSLSTDSNASRFLGGNDTIYLHINGSIETLSKETLNNQFKLTDTSYNTSAFNANEWGKLFSQDLNTYPVTIFIGFTMNYDLDIKRIVSTVNKDKCIFVVREDEPDVTVRMLQKYGCVEKIGFDGFFDKVSEIQKDFVRDDFNNSISLSNFEKYSCSPSLHEPADSDVLQFYKFGKKSVDLYHGKGEGYKAIVKREIIKNIIEAIDAGIESVFIHSDIGNGKTEIVDQLCYELASKYTIYKLINNNEKLSKEIENICQTTDKKIVVIENFFNYYDVYEEFKLFNSYQNITFVFTARTSIYKARYEPFSIGKVATFDVNRLSGIDIEKLVDIFIEYGYYPKGRVDNDYKEYIAKKYNSKLQSIILGIFENETITNSLKGILREIKSMESTSQDLLLFMIISKVMNLELNFCDIQDLLSIKSLDYSFEKNLSVNELIKFDGEKTSIKSVIVCTWLLKNYDNSSKVIDLLVSTAKQADIGSRINKKYEMYLGNIVSYRHLKFILSLLGNTTSEKLKLINEFYQQVKNIGYYKNKYFFWLQYGISAMELNDLAGAEHHFNAALRKIGDDDIPFEINNQYARLKMELMLHPEYSYNTSTFSNFCEINKMLTPTSAQEDDEYYCYKMSSSYYGKIFEKFYFEMTEEEQMGMEEIARKNHCLCMKYMLKNGNNSLIKNISEFAGVFEKLSNFGENNSVFLIEHITKSFAFGKIKIKGELVPASLHISRITGEHVANIYDYFSVGQQINVKVLSFSEKHGKWQVSCN